MGAGRPDKLARLPALVTAEIVEDDDIAWAQDGNQNLFDVGKEGFAVDWTIEDEGRFDVIVPQGGEERQGLPVAMRDVGMNAASARPPAPERRHVGLDPRLVDEQQAPAVDAGLMGPPTDPLTGDVGARPLAGAHGFF